MIELSGIIATDEINRYHHKIEFQAYYNNYLTQWNDHIPFFMNHDHTKPIGYTKFEGFYITPGKLYVMNSSCIPENSSEEAAISKYCLSQFYHTQIEENKESFEKLKTKVGNFLSEDYKLLYNGGAYIYDKNIVRKIFPDLCSKINEGLIELTQLTPIAPGVYKIGDFMICAHRYFRRGLSILNTLNEPFLEKLQSLTNSESKIQIAIDMDLIGLADSYVKTFEYQYWWGPHFSDDLTEIPYGVTIHKNEKYNPLSSPIKQTEFRWYEQDDKHTFECEEILDTPNVKEENEELYGCRFIHSMVDNVSQKPIHLDGAIRAYTLEKMCKRIETNLDKTARDTIYAKIWRIDNLLSIATWKELITHYYRDNMMIGEYFGGKDEQLTPSSNSTETSLKKKSLNTYIPFHYPKEDFLSFSMSFQAKSSPSENFDLQIIPLQSILVNNTDSPTIDYMAIPLLKLLKKEKMKFDVNDYAYISCHDNIHNFPHFLCSNTIIAQNVLNNIKLFLTAWNNNLDEIISFTLEYPEEDRNIKLSFIGKKSNFIQYFNSKEFKALPNNKEELFQWCNNLYKFISKTYNQRESIDPLSVFKNGDLFYRRKMLPKEKIDSYETDSHGISAKIILTNNELELIQSENIGFICVNWNREIKCNKCHSSYLDCDCVLYIDHDVECTIKDFKILGCAWYDLASNKP